MEKHVKFRSGEQNNFIEVALYKSKLSIGELAKLVSISPRNFRDWKREKLSMTSSSVKLISSKFHIKLEEEIQLLEERWQKYKSAKGKIGGNVFKKLYGNPATDEGRRKGGKRALEVLRQKGLIPPVKTFKSPRKSKNLAEFIGIMLGDGGITDSQITVTLNREADRDYISYVKNLLNTLFGEYPKHLKRKGSLADSIYYNGINIVKNLEKLGLRRGNKVRQQVEVPKWIHNNKEYSKSCCRGLMDTDGCIAIHRYYVGGKRYFYKKLIFTNHSIPLANFVFSTLLNNGLHPKMFSNLEKRRVWLYNSNEVIQYLDRIGSSNERLLRFRNGE